MKCGLHGDVDYSVYGVGYASNRQADPRIAALIHEHLGDAQTVLNVGAGAGSYEPADRHVIALEPSEAMRLQRRPNLAPCIRGSAEDIPFDDNTFDAVMATITIHQWSDVKKGLQELRRVSKKRVVILTFDRTLLQNFWLNDYAPLACEIDSRRFPPTEFVQEILGGAFTDELVPVPLDCTDGFTEAFYGRPEKFLQPEVRKSQSVWSFVDEPTNIEAMDRLAHDLGAGIWDDKYGHLRTQPFYEGSLKILKATY